MTNMKKIDYDNWDRREYYEFFKVYDNPFYCLTSEVRCTNAYKKAKDTNSSFYAYYMYLSHCAMLEVENFRYRIVDNEVVSFDDIHIGMTISRPSHNFGFGYMDFNRDFEVFKSDLQKEIDSVQKTEGLLADKLLYRKDIFNYTVFPFATLKGFDLPTIHIEDYCNPLVIFGKAEYNFKNELILPIAVCAHHGFVDGFHIGEYMRIYQEMLDQV